MTGSRPGDRRPARKSDKSFRHFAIRGRPIRMNTSAERIGTGREGRLRPRLSAYHGGAMWLLIGLAGGKEKGQGAAVTH